MNPIIMANVDDEEEEENDGAKIRKSLHVSCTVTNRHTSNLYKI